MDRTVKNFRFHIYGLILVGFVFQNCSQTSFDRSMFNSVKTKDEISDDAVGKTILRSLQNEESLLSAIAEEANESFDCLRNVSSCEAVRYPSDFSSWHLINRLYNTSGDIIYDVFDQNLGYDVDGEPCQQGREGCDFRAELRWMPVCQSTGNCVDPQVQFKIKIIPNEGVQVASREPASASGGAVSADSEDGATSELSATDITSRIQSSCEGSDDPRCEAVQLVKACTAANADSADRRWDAQARAMGQCIVRACSNAYSRDSQRNRCVETTVRTAITNGTRIRRWNGNAYDTSYACNSRYQVSGTACVARTYGGTGCGSCPFGTETKELNLFIRSTATFCRLGGWRGRYKAPNANYTAYSNANNYGLGATSIGGAICNIKSQFIPNGTNYSWNIIR